MDVERLEFLFGPGAADLVDGYDLDSESDRMALVDELLPLPPGARHRQPRTAVRAVVVGQILTDDPPETWRTAQRLTAAGLDLDRVLSQLSMVLTEHLASAMGSGSGSRFDTAAFVAALDELPLPSGSEVARAVVDIVRAQPGVDVMALVDQVVASRASGSGRLVESMTHQVIDGLTAGPLHLLPGDAAVYVPDLVDGRTFTHRLNDAEAELEVLTASFDLAACSRFETIRLPDGTELEQFSADRDHLAWRGPEGWLAAFEPGDLLAVTVTVEARDGGVDEPLDAAVRIERADSEPEVTDDVVRAVRAGYEIFLADLDTPVTGEELWYWLCFHHPELFDRLRPPLDELCASTGLEQRSGRVAHDERIWRRDLAVRRSDRLAGLVPETHWRLMAARAMETLDDPNAPVDEVRAALDDCAEPEVLDAIADVLFPHYLDLADEFELGPSDAPGHLFELVGRAMAVARRPRETATAEYLACVLYERCGAPERAEEHLARAASAQPRLGPVVERMGWYRFDRGDARGAMKWWRELEDLPDAAATIQPFLAPGAGHKLGRNEPCWCGSGRKFKQCHQNAAELPALPDRVGWLCRKAAVWLEHSTGDVRASVVRLAAVRATADPDAGMDAMVDDDAMLESLRAAFDDPIVFDAALHEAGLFGLFLRERGALLPEDEQLLVASWETVDRSVHEVVAVDPGVGMTLRDLATGEVAEVRERTASQAAQVGERYCGRVVPDGATNQLIGSVFPVRTGHESTVLDLCAARDAAELCAWVGALHQPPTIVHTPGMADSMFDTAGLDAAVAAPGEGADEEAVSAAIDAELSRQAQARWLDEHVPALDGLTPREAAADPTRREQLERLLDEFDRMEERLRSGSSESRVAMYDVAALRRELGLT